MRARYRALAWPYALWMFLFIVLPVLLVLGTSLLVRDPSAERGVVFSLENYRLFFDPLYLGVSVRSLRTALLCTALCLLIGYPVAYRISRMPRTVRNSVLLLFILPMWMNMLLRTYAWMTILGNNGLINQFLAGLGLPRLPLLYNNTAILIGMVYSFLPFMVLPIYTSLSRTDPALLEAAHDLGADRWTTFRRVTLPLSMPGVVSGIVMVFMPAVSSFVIPRLLGGNRQAYIGTLLENLFLVTGNWHFGSAIAILMMLVILASLAVMNRFEPDREGGQGLW